MNAVAPALAEIIATLAALAPAHEGLRDYAALNIQRETQVEVRTSLAAFDARVTKLIAAKVALEALIATPDGPPRDITPAVLKDLQDQAATIAAALKTFTSEPAIALGLTGQPPEPK